MLNDRQQRLIKHLKTRMDTYQKGSELALLFGVSERTIRLDIEHINRSHTVQIVGSKQGYQLQAIDDKETESKQVVPQTSKERQDTILLRLLYGEKRLNITQLAQSFYISESLLLQDIEHIRRRIANQNVQVIRKDNCLYLAGDELAKRTLFKQHLLAEKHRNLLEIDWLNQRFEGYDVHAVLDVFDQISNTYGYALHTMAYQVLLIHLVIALERIKKGYYMNVITMEQYEETVEYKVAKDLFDYLQKRLQCNIPEAEIVSFTRLLVANRLRIVQDQHAISELCIKAIQELSTYFSIDFCKDEELMIGLSIHLEYMLYRMKHHVEIENALLHEVKHTMPLVFELAIQLGNILSKQVGVQLKDSELGFLALHVGAALNRIEQSNQFRVVLLNPFANRLGQVFKEKLKQAFVNEIIIVDEIAYYNKNRIKYSQPDFIISPIECNQEIPVIQVKLELDYQDINKIRSYMESIQKHQELQNIFTLASTIFDASLFFYDLQASSVPSLLTSLCNQLVMQDAVDQDFYHQVMERERVSSTSFDQFFAVPHAMTCNAKQTKVVVAILDKPIMWNKYLVKVVLLFAIKETDRIHLKALYRLISEMLLDRKTFDSILKCNDFNQFYNLMMQYYYAHM